MSLNKFSQFQLLQRWPVCPAVTTANFTKIAAHAVKSVQCGAPFGAVCVCVHPDSKLRVNGGP